MPNVSAFITSPRYRPVEELVVGDTVLPGRFGDVGQEYRAAREGVALFDRGDRGLLVLTGADRTSWLQNLVTNDVAGLGENAGTYAFATDVKGRVVFDLNVLALRDALWLDIDRALIPRALAHLERFLISEDVRTRDASAEFSRLGWSGPGAGGIAEALGFAAAADMPARSSTALEGDGTRLVRHDFTGLPGYELIVPFAQAAAWWDRLVAAGAAPAGFHVLDALRIEAGIPWFGREIDEKVVAPEADPAGCAISYKKGCYLGQEVIERMRSRGVQARRLVRLRASPAVALDLPADLRKGGQTVGRITSLVRPPVEPVGVGLGYVGSSVRDLCGIECDASTELWVSELDAHSVMCR